MWYILITIILSIFLGVIVHIKCNDKIATTCITATALIVSGALCYPIVGLTTGIENESKNGSFEGYVGGINQEGILFKTSEMELYQQVESWTEVLESKASGEDHKHEIRVSLANVSIQKQAKALIGKRVLIKYNYWPISKFSHAATSYQVTEINLKPQ